MCAARAADAPRRVQPAQQTLSPMGPFDKSQHLSQLCSSWGCARARSAGPRTRHNNAKMRWAQCTTLSTDEPLLLASARSSRHKPPRPNCIIAEHKLGNYNQGRCPGVWPARARGCCLKLAIVGKNWTERGRVFPKLVKFGQSRPNSGRVVPNLAKFGASHSSNCSATLQLALAGLCDGVHCVGYLSGNCWGLRPRARDVFSRYLCRSGNGAIDAASFTMLCVSFFPF